MKNVVKLELDDSTKVVSTIRAATGLPDAEWIRVAIGVYFALLCHSSDNTIRLLLDDGQVATMGLTYAADEILLDELSKLGGNGGGKGGTNELNNN